MARLRIRKDNVLLSEMELAAAEIKIGREPGNDVRLADLTVSRVHARIWPASGNRFKIEDLQSTNGVLINGHRLTSAALLTDGDEVKIGAYELTFSDEHELATLRLELTKLYTRSFAAPHQPSEPSTGTTGMLINEANNAVFAIANGKAALGNEGQVDIRVPAREKIRAAISQRGTEFYICSETAQPCVRLNGVLVMNAKLAFNDRIEVGGRRFIFREM
jgi:pSer/pThr/pTyr-binding forkhead associated (FHA) protein